MSCLEILIITSGAFLAVIIATWIISFTVLRIKKLNVCVKYREHMMKLNDANSLMNECRCYRCKKDKNQKGDKK